jgi:FkbM family methyltransferase
MDTVSFLHRNAKIIMNTHNTPDYLFNYFSTYKDFYELDLLQKATYLYRSGSHIIDVGANIGNHTVYFAKMLSAKVMAFEPFEKSREILFANISANKCAELVSIKSCALGDTTGRARAVSPNMENFGTVSVTSDPAGELTMGRLDDYVVPGMDVSILKIDVEGGEMPVLRGAVRTLAICRPHIFAEAQEPEKFEEISAFLNMFGYRKIDRFCYTPTYLFSV